jgi:hypothetical protein
MNFHDFGRGDSCKSIAEDALDPKTKRRLSGWLSKNRMFCIFRPPEVVAGNRLTALMIKIFLVWLGRRPFAEELGIGFERAAAGSLTKGAGKAVTRLRKLFLFIEHATAIYDIVATAHGWDFLIPRVEGEPKSVIPLKLP